MPPCRAWASLPVLLAALVVVSADEGCSSPVMDALAENEDLPLSLIQVRAVATRSNRTDLANRTLNTTLPTKPGSQFPNERMVTTEPFNYDALRVLYFALLIGVVIFSVYAFAHYVRSLSEARSKKQSIPKMQHLVDHLVVTSSHSFSPQADNTKNPLTPQAKQSKDGFQKGPKMRPPQNVGVGKTPVLEQTSLAQKSHRVGEAIDPALVLPLRETWYTVAVEHMLKADGSCEIMRMTGCLSLRASVSYSSSCGGALELFSCSGGATKHLLARAASSEPANCNGEDALQASKLPLTLVGVEGRHLGELRLLSHKKFELTCDSETVVTLVVNDEGQLEVLSARGSRLACVSCLAGHLGICVEAGTDTALVICLVLAVVLLGGAGEYVLPHGSDDRYEGQVVCTPDIS